MGGGETVFDVSSAHKSKQHFDCGAKRAHLLERSSLTVL